MAEDPPQRHPTSPITLLLQTLGMTRDDLVRHSTQMRNFLEAESNGFQPSDHKAELVQVMLPDIHGVRSRTQSLTNLSLAGPSSYAASPPRTPVKAEPVERGIPTRPKDTMEMVMERKSKEKKRARKESMSRSRDTREERVEPRQNLTTPSRPSDSQNFETPHHYRYYSERVIGGVTPKGETSASESPTKGRHYRPPKTPTRRLLDSPRMSSPMSSPAVVNLVSSPGPMRSEAEAESDDLPFTLPPGPYSSMKPDACYAAIIGQAILSSPQHRLTLQDIYEWITIVYPFYKRGEQTWMNSVRHALSTMAVFRKVPRQRQEGKSLWAIWDCDVPCFANGDFKKSLCVDMVKAKPEPAKTGPKKRVSTEQTSNGRASKRRRKDPDEPAGQPLPPMLPAPILPPFYSANIIPGTHHQPYYQTQPTFVPQPVPAEVIFPPLPASSSYHHVRSASSQPLSRAPSAASMTSERSMTGHSSPSWSTAPPPSSDSSVPDLTLDAGSSSSPQLSQENLATDDDLEACSEEVEEQPRSRKNSVPAIADPEDEFERWLASDTDFSLLGTPLSNRKLSSRSASGSTGKTARHILDFFEMPDSPTLQRKSAKKPQKRIASSSSPSTSQVIHSSSGTPSTPPPRHRTPPRRSSNTYLQLSPQRTPISHRGLHMSPSASLAHYKTNLDPPPPPPFHSHAPLLFDGDNSSLPLPSPDLLRTPRRKDKQVAGTSSTPSSSSRLFGSIFGPVTPKRLNFGSGDGSPLRTPSRGILDPHDPSALLDEELARLGNQSGSGHTPTGLFGNMRGMLYESPGLTSPGRWDRYW